MNTTQQEKRYQEIQFTQTEGRTVKGLAVVFNSQSNVLAGWDKPFVEVISPEAITTETIQRSDIKALMEHNRERLLARSRKGVGSLKLELTQDGLEFEFEMPNTTTGNDALELIRRGDISGCSFAFSLPLQGGDNWTTTQDGTPLRVITQIERLYDITLTSDPAYNDTTLTVRSVPTNAPEVTEEQPQEQGNTPEAAQEPEEATEATPQENTQDEAEYIRNLEARI